MGADIHGWVEGRTRWIDDEEVWFGLINAGSLLHRNYEAFARLFGVRNYDNLPALAPDRGFPPVVSDEVQLEFETMTEKKLAQYLDFEHDFHSATWASWEELETVDWSPFNESFQILWQLMNVLSQSTDFSEIRLVVWFDS